MNPVIRRYRDLLRAVRSSFKGDETMIIKATENIRARFEANKHESDPSVIQAKLSEAEEAASFIRDYVVQSIQNESGNFRIKPTPQQISSMQEHEMEPIDETMVPHSNNGSKFK